MNKYEENFKKQTDIFFPSEIIDNIFVKSSSFEEISKFIIDAWEDVFGYSYPLKKTNQKQKPAKKFLIENYREKSSFYFTFCDEKSEKIGWSISEIQDATTLYIRNSGIFPEYRRRGLYSKFMLVFFDYLKELGFERITSHHKEKNKAILQAKLKLGFYICGYEFHEQWGRHIKMVKFLYPEQEKLFLELR